MLFAYLDEFGHVGPFVNRTHEKYRESPVFGMAGVILPEAAIRPFATRFLQLKEHVFAADIAKAGKMAAKWEKKGADIYRPGALERYEELRRSGFRLLNAVNGVRGKVFYYGREKVHGSTDVNPNGLYTTVFAHTIRQLEAYAASVGQNFAIVVDQHSARKELLECAAKTMFGRDPTKHLVSPPFEVESYLNQNIQAADWVAAMIGRMWAYKLLPEQYPENQVVEKYYADRLAQLATHSKVDRRKRSEAADGVTQKTLRFSVLDGGAVPKKAASSTQRTRKSP